MESKTNITNIPLNASAIFIGTYEDASPYISAVVSILADTEATITCYQSLNKQRTTTTTLQYTNVSDLQTFIISPITLPYIYFIVQNSSSTNQTYLNFSVKYVSTTVSSGGGAGTDVNITNAQIPVSQSGNWNVNSTITNSSIAISGAVDINNFPETQDVNITNPSVPVVGSVEITNESLNVAVSNFPLAPLSTYLGVQVMNESLNCEGLVFNLQLLQLQGINSNVAVMNPKLDTIVSNSNTQLNRTAKGYGTLWNASSTGVNGVSTALNLSNSTQQNITFFGNVNSATTLTVQFSLNGVNWYSSQYSYTASASGDIGFNVQCSVYHVRLLSTNDVNATIYASYN